MSRHLLDTWDYQVVYAAMRNNALTVTPNLNLVDNVGFDSNATHTRKAPKYLRPRGSVSHELREMPVIFDQKADAYAKRRVFRFRLGRP